MKHINATFDIENDLEEYKLRQILESIGAKYIKTLPNTEHLKDNETFKKLKASKRKSESNLYEFINKNRILNK